MTAQSGTVPGPIADRTYDSAFKIAAIAGVTGVFLLFWLGPLSVSISSHVVFVALFYPVYLLTASVVLGVWLGYTTDEKNLVRVYESVDDENEEQ
jgi:hypothetical protein